MQNGDIVEIAIYDEVNKMVCIKTETGNQWYHEQQYSIWLKEGEEEKPVAFERADPTEAVEKKKRVYKKKEQ